MKRILFVSVLIVAFASLASAQTPSFELGIGGGLSKPLGTIGDLTNSGYNFNASVGYTATPLFIIGAELGFFGNGGSDEAIALLGSGADFSTSSMQFTAMAKYMVPVAAHGFYGKGLIGGYRLASESTTQTFGTLSLASTNFGFGIGGGFQFKGTQNSAIYAEGMYHRINAEGANGEFATVNLGVLFSL